MITRAICLLVIVGDSNALNYDANWKQLINYCEEKNALVCGDRKLYKRVTAPEK